MSKDKEYTEGIAVRGGFLAWLDNYWYHYKWATIIVAFFLVVALICTVQACSREKEDLIIVYAGREYISPAEASQISSVLESIAPEDFDGDGKKNITFNTYNIRSKEQIKELNGETDAAGNKLYGDNGFFTSQYSAYNNYLKTGESSILFLEGWEYESLLSHGMLARLDTALTELPDSAFSEYGIKLGDTDLYEQYGVIRLMPADTVICLMKPLAVGKSHKEEYYAREKKMLCAIAEFVSDESTSEE